MLRQEHDIIYPSRGQWCEGKARIRQSAARYLFSVPWSSAIERAPLSLAPEREHLGRVTTDRHLGYSSHSCHSTLSSRTRSPARSTSYPPTLFPPFSQAHSSYGSLIGPSPLLACS